MLTRRALLPVLAAIPANSLHWRDELVPRSRRNRLLFGGDVMFSRYVGALARAHGDPAWPLREVAPFLRAADVTFVNLESPFSDHDPIYRGKMVFKAEPEMIAALKLAGVDVVSTANNHARDCGAHGVTFTMDWLKRNGMTAAGTGETAAAAHAGAVIERNTVRFGFLGYTFDDSNGNFKDRDERVALIDADAMRSDVAAMLRHAQVAIVSMHAGVEYSRKPNRQQISFARAAIEAGARVVVGHHPHVVQAWERYRDGVIFYSLGNLVFDQFQRAETRHGALAELIFEGAELRRAAMIPVDLVRTAPRLAASRETSPAG